MCSACVILVFFASGYMRSVAGKFQAYSGRKVKGFMVLFFSFLTSFHCFASVAMPTEQNQSTDLPFAKGEFLLPQSMFRHKYEVKKSEFICLLYSVESRAEAMSVLAQAKVQYPDARHHCWAYILGLATSQAFNDDGEPSGTAGKPILNVLQHRGMGNTMAIVVRYFGGVKLGAGGLVRAYSQATQQAIELCPLKRFVPQKTMTLDCPYELEPNLRRFLTQHDACIIRQDYGSTAQFDISFPESKLPDVESWLSNHFQVSRIVEDH